MYDIIIIGAGIAGLYSAYNIKKLHPNTNLLVLESNKRHYIGGRIGNDNFYNESIVVGAGVGRKDTDKLLIKLLNELNISYKQFIVSMNYSYNVAKNLINVKDSLIYLRQEYRKYKKPPIETFKQFAIKCLGPNNYKNFVISSGYSDYENEDVYEVLYHYQMEDNAPGWSALQINWNTLISKLCSKIGMKNILTSTKVVSVIKNEKDYKIICENNKIFLCKKVIIATRISTVQKLLPTYNIYKQIYGQPFLYIYAKFDKESSEVMSQVVSTYTIVTGPLQKMIPFSKSVYMIAYCDNKNAELLAKHKENTLENRMYFEKLVEKALGLIPGILKILAIKDYYWPIGTHYYGPLDHKNRQAFIKEAQHPQKDMLVVGEAVSRRQGWTEGALQSVANVLSEL